MAKGPSVFHQMVVVVKENVHDYHTRVEIFEEIITILESEKLMPARYLIGEDAAYDEAYKKIRRKE